MPGERKVRLTSVNALSKCERIKPMSDLVAKGGSAKLIRNPKVLIQEVLRSSSPLVRKRIPGVQLKTAPGRHTDVAAAGSKRTSVTHDVVAAGNGKITIVQPTRMRTVQPPRITIVQPPRITSTLRSIAAEPGSGKMRSALITQPPKPRVVITQPKRKTSAHTSRAVANMFRSPLRLTGARAFAESPMRRDANFSAGVLRSKHVFSRSRVKRSVLKEKLVLRQRWLPPLSSKVKLFPRKTSDSDSPRSSNASAEPARRWQRRSSSGESSHVRGKRLKKSVSEASEVDNVSDSRLREEQSSRHSVAESKDDDRSSHGSGSPARKEQSPSPVRLKGRHSPSSPVRRKTPARNSVSSSPRKGRRGRSSVRKERLVSTSPEHKERKRSRSSSPSVKVVKTSGFLTRKRADEGSKKTRVRKNETDKGTKKEKNKAARKKAEKARLQEKEKARQLAKKEDKARHEKATKERKPDEERKGKERKKSTSNKRRRTSLGSEKHKDSPERKDKKEKKARKRARSVSSDSSSDSSSAESKSSRKKSKHRKKATPKKRKGDKSKSPAKKRSITIKPGHVGVCVRYSTREAVRAFPKRSRLHEVVSYYKKHWSLEGEYGFGDIDHSARLDSLDDDIRTREDHILLRLSKG